MKSSYFSSKKIWLMLLISSLLAAGGWLYFRRTQRVDLASYVPESALVYFEVNDWPRLLDRFSGTLAWKQLAPQYGIKDRLSYLGKVGWLASLAGGNETSVLARSQFAVVITGIEVQGEKVRPHLALIAETHSDQDDVRKVIERRLPEFARKIYGREVKQTGDYAGVKLESYSANDPDRQMFSAQIGSEWILANHPDPLHACIDTRLGRASSIANNFYLQNTRPVVSPGGDLFGFVTGEGLARLSRFGAFLLSSGALRENVITDLLQDVFSDLASRASDGIAYGVSFDNGQVVDRHTLLIKPALIERLRPAIKINPNQPQSFNYIPSRVRDFTVINVEDPNKTLERVEGAVSTHVGVAQSFLLHQFLLGAREALFGLKSGEAAHPVLGNEIASFGFNEKMEDRVWLVAVRDRQLLARVVERYLTLEGATIERQNYQGTEILVSSDPRKGAAAFVGDFLALSGRPQLIRTIDARRQGESLKAAEWINTTGVSPAESVIMSFSSVKAETIEMMALLTQWLGGQANTPAGLKVFDQLPFSASSTSLNERGIYIESRSPFGNFPFFVSLVDGATGDRLSQYRER